MLLPGSTPAPQLFPLQRNVPAWLNTCTSFFLAGIQPVALENSILFGLGMQQPGLAPPQQTPIQLRNVLAGLNICTSLFLTLKSTPSRQPSAGSLENSSLLWLGMLQPGSTPAPQYPPSRGMFRPAGSPHLHLTFPHSEILSESPAFCRQHWRPVSCTLLGMLRPGSTPAQQYLPEECSGRAQHLHLTLRLTIILSESPVLPVT
jgi:hypothetical protein